MFGASGAPGAPESSAQWPEIAAGLLRGLADSMAATVASSRPWCVPDDGRPREAPPKGWRCGECYTCGRPTLRQACLTASAAMAAAEGKLGGVLSLLGERAVGRRIAVCSDGGDGEVRAWGTVAAFEPFKRRHTVRYDAGTSCAEALHKLRIVEGANM